jgi:hypothetical protein
VASTCAIASPAGAEVSTAQSSATSARLCFCAVAINPVKWIIERESRSSFATTSAFASPASSARKASCTAGRFKVTRRTSTRTNEHRHALWATGSAAPRLVRTRIAAPAQVCSTVSAVSADADGGEGADLVLGQRDVHHVALDPGDGPDRDGDLLSSPEVAALEDEVRDVLVRVDQEAVHLAE